VDDYYGRSGARKSLQWAIDAFKSGKSARVQLGIDTVADGLYAQEYGAE
jgi:hypothetical protein